MSGTFYLIATPIGNLGDITYRAIETLKGLDILFSEDTRRTLKLLNHFDIRILVKKYNSYSTKKDQKKILAFLKEGKNIGYCVDAGTPGISDPGSSLIAFLRNENINIIPIPGVSALTTALSISGMDTSRFYFAGFLSPKKGRRKKALKELMELKTLIIIYESPFRVESLIIDIQDIFGSDIRIGIFHELTKVHESVLLENPNAIIKEFRKNPPRGEFIVIIDNYKKNKRGIIWKKT